MNSYGAGTPAEAPCALPLPDKKALEIILDKLQRHATLILLVYVIYDYTIWCLRNV